jgi:hypothetical protein
MASVFLMAAGGSDDSTPIPWQPHQAMADKETTVSVSGSYAIVTRRSFFAKVHYTDESIKKTKEWVLRNTVCGEIRQLIPKHKKGDDLRKELGIDTKKRMLSLIYKIRSKYFEKNVEGAWCKRVA